jgi:putative NADPH-quinone reductase
MRLLVVFAHPLPDGFGASLRDEVLRAAAAAGHEADLLDLYAEGFDPVMSEAERRFYHDAPVPDELAPHVARLRRAEGLILVFPTWWYGQPAILKGWIDRVWRPGVAFDMPKAGGWPRPALTNLRLLGVVTTLGSPWWWWTLGMGAPGRKQMIRGLGQCCARRRETFWLGLHGMDGATEARRRRFLARVGERVRRIPR